MSIVLKTKKFGGIQKVRVVRIKTICFTILLSLSYPLSLTAQTNPSSSNFYQTLKFEHITLEQGLSDVSVNSIFQDSIGFMWFGTDDGLNKYDGYNLTIYRHDPDDNNSIKDNIIESIYEDRSGSLWVGTLRGWLERFDRKTQKFTHYHVGSHVLAIHQDPEGTFWIGTQDPGLLRFDSNSGDTLLVWKGRYFSSITEDHEGSVWAVSGSEGLGRFDKGQDKFERYDISPPLRTILLDRSGRFWCGSVGRGLIQFERSTEEFTYFRHDPNTPNSLSSDKISSLVEDHSGILWIGTFDAGLNRYDPGTGRVTRYRHNSSDPHSLSDDHILTMYQDRSGFLWIGTLFGGLNKVSIERNNFSHYYNIPTEPNSPGDDVVEVIHEDRTGVLWIGTIDGLDRFDRKENKWRHYYHNPHDPGGLSDNYVWSIYEDRSGNLWIGTSAGLDKYDKINERFIHYPTHRSHAMIEDKAGNFLIATTQGLYRFDPDGKEKVVLLRKGYAWKISLFEDRHGMLWVGSSGDGVERYDPETGEWRLFRHDPDDPGSLSNNFVESILEDRSGVLWFGTAGGLNKLVMRKVEGSDSESGIFRHYREKDGLVNDWIYGVLQDRQGYLWLSTAKGISRLDPRTETFKNYRLNNPYNRGAYHQSKNGEIFLGGIKGFNSFFPERIVDNPHIPPIVFTGFSLFNRPVSNSLSADERIELSHGENFISFDFAALDYAAPEKNQYAYMMEGLDEDWVYAGTRRHVDYPDLKPGTYTLWFRSSIFLLVSLFAFAGYKKRVSKIEAKRKALEIQVQEKTEAAKALQNALTEVEELKNRLHAENVYLQDEIKLIHNFEDIITDSEVLKKVLSTVEQVAATDATVLILGETGTGKELLARAIHSISRRSNRPLVKVNCATLPENLIESELFGHEKGAFTGAVTRKIGRFELAHGGTIFLDEIGDMPLGLQTKFLRVLQEGEFERLGNPQTIKVDARVISATNRNLEKAVEYGAFREDLFYRLNVFPIVIPPLRERKEDILLLAKHFMKKYTRKPESG
jgi:ligand-binding sensor domain-containing protein